MNRTFIVASEMEVTHGGTHLIGARGGAHRCQDADAGQMALPRQRAAGLDL